MSDIERHYLYTVYVLASLQSCLIPTENSTCFLCLSPQLLCQSHAEPNNIEGGVDCSKIFLDKDIPCIRPPRHQKPRHWITRAVIPRHSP